MFPPTPEDDAAAIIPEIAMYYKPDSLEYCEALAREKAVYESYFPHTRRGGYSRFPRPSHPQAEDPHHKSHKSQNAPHQSHNSYFESYASSSPNAHQSELHRDGRGIEPYILYKARQTGTSKSTVARDVQIGVLLLEFPLLKSCGLTKTQLLRHLVPMEKSERQALFQELALSTNPAEFLRQKLPLFRPKPVTPEEDAALKDGQSRIRQILFHIQSLHRLLKTGPVPWLCLELDRLSPFVRQGLLTDLIKLLQQEEGRANHARENYIRDWSASERPFPWDR